ncbi:hypothetical protein BD769DRAFT_1398037 [Suillus cothurnatus]|nr:hypothetical protein BD769DRAFT_1398037 [Suillus cothurnatus]
MATQPLRAFFPIVSSTLVLVYRSHCCSMKTTSPSSWICIPKFNLKFKAVFFIQIFALSKRQPPHAYRGKKPFVGRYRVTHKNPEGVHQSRIISRAGPTPRESFLAALSLLIDAKPTQLPHCSTIIGRPYKITFGREVYFALDLDFEFENPHNFLDLPLQLTSSPILANYTKWLKAQRMCLTSFAQGMPKHEEKSVWSMDVDPDVVTEIPLRPEERSDGYMDAGGDVMMEILNSEESDARMDVDGDVVMEILEPEDELDSSMDVDVDVTTEDMFVE